MRTLPLPPALDNRRVAACVAACAGINTRALERGALTDLFRAVTTLIEHAEQATPREVVIPADALQTLAAAIGRLMGDER